MLPLVATALAEPPPPPCAGRVGTEALSAVLVEATSAFSGLDLEGFGDAHRRAIALLPCLDQPLGPLDAVQIHQVDALATFLAQDRAAMVAALASVKAIAPDYSLPSTLAPKGHPLRVAFDEPSPPELAATRDLPVPDAARLLVDGQPVLDLPTARPSVVQLLLEGGEVSWTTRVPPGGELPAYATLPDAVREQYLAEARVIRVKDRKPIELVAAAGLAAVASGATYGASVASRARFMDRETPPDELAGLRARTNGLQTASVVSLAAAGAFGGVAVVVW